MSDIQLSVFGSAFSAAEFEAVAGPLHEDWVGLGPEVTRFEQALSARIGGAEVILVSSGSAALHLAVQALNLPRGSHFLVPANTWNSCANAIVLAGLVPVFVDCDSRTGNVTPSLVEMALTEHTAGLMVVHYAGYPVDMDGMARFGLPIIEDAAHAIDSTYRGRLCGSIGDIGIYSFDSVKNIATPDLGAVVTKNSEVAQWVRSVRYSGIAKSGADASAESKKWWVPDQVAVMPKYAPNDIAAVLGLSQLKRLSALQSKREELWGLYMERLANIDGLVLPLYDSDFPIRHSWFTFFLHVPRGVRDKLARYLLANGVYTTVRYFPLHLLDIFKGPPDSPKKVLPGAEKFANEVLNLPLHPRMSRDQVNLICDLIEKFLCGQSVDRIFE